MAQITEYQNYTFAGMRILKRYEFIDEIWQMIKEYMGIYGIPVLFIPKFLKLTKKQMCYISDTLLSYDPVHIYCVSLKTYKKNILIKKILTRFFDIFPKKPLHIRNGLMDIALDYMKRNGVMVIPRDYMDYI